MAPEPDDLRVLRDAHGRVEDGADLFHPDLVRQRRAFLESRRRDFKLPAGMDPRMLQHAKEVAAVMLTLMYEFARKDVMWDDPGVSGMAMNLAVERGWVTFDVQSAHQGVDPIVVTPKGRRLLRYWNL